MGNDVFGSIDVHSAVLPIFSYSLIRLEGYSNSMLVTGILYAEPPDDICDPLKNATPGLYGLCNAFCVAQPSHGLGTLDLSKSQTRILKAYNKKKTSDDPDMPCFQGCPCFSVEEAEFVATHPYFYNCVDYVNKPLGSIWYERWQSIDLWGDISPTGYAQTRGNVSAVQPEPDSENPPWVLICNWSFHVDSPFLDIGSWWEGDYFNEEDQRKIEDCQAIIEHVSEKNDLPCETLPECEIRILITNVDRDDLSIEVIGSLINDPPQGCVNKSPIARVDWYWGDGSMDTFGEMPDGYVHPFPNSHTYSQSGIYLWTIYAFEKDGKILDFTSRLAFLW